ncbi:MAG: glycosyltransferase family 39 protein [Candidatus Pacearchaeota archaeon]|jgi:4-amino-4-deoxy-L-arabinose transferase-like glycosyltransferase
MELEANDKKGHEAKPTEETAKKPVKNDDKLVKFFKENYIIISILIFAFIVAFYYFNITKTQPLWWDEAEYLSTAKHWAFGVPYNLNPQRPPLFQFLSALSFIVGFGEQFIKIFLVLFPYLFLIFAVYLLGKEMYNKNIGYIAAFLTSVSWTLLFWSQRVQPDFFSMSFQVLSILFMWKFWKSSDESKNKSKLVIFAGIFAALGFLFKISGLLVPILFIVFIFVKDRFSALKNKYYYYFAAAFIATLIPDFIWSYFTFGDPLAIFHSGYSVAIGTATPFAWNTINFFYLLTENILFILFLFGTVLALQFLLYFDVIIKDRKKAFDPNIFSILSLIIITSFYIFYTRAIEDRWVFLWLPFIFFFIGNALLFIHKSLKKYNKNIAIIVVLILLLIGGYVQLTQANASIEGKKDSYIQIKDASLWIKQHLAKNESSMSISYTQTTYYSEHLTLSYSLLNETQFNQFVLDKKPKYILISVIEPNHPEWIYTWAPANPNKLIPVQVYFLDSAKTQPVAVIYQFNMSAFK